MKTLVPFCLALCLLFAGTAFSQEQKTAFAKANVAKAGDGAACAELAWKKGNENTSYYLVERSTNGKAFKQIALVFTGEDNALVDYKFRDKGYAASGNTVYYRIGMVGENKELTYLPVQKVEPSSSAIANNPTAELKNK